MSSLRQLGEHGPGRVPAADRESEPAARRHSLARLRRYVRRRLRSDGGTVGEYFQLVLHRLVLLLRVPAELRAHGRQHLVGEVTQAA